MDKNIDTYIHTATDSRREGLILEASLGRKHAAKHYPASLGACTAEWWVQVSFLPAQYDTKRGLDSKKSGNEVYYLNS